MSRPREAGPSPQGNPPSDGPTHSGALAAWWLPTLLAVAASVLMLLPGQPDWGRSLAWLLLLGAALTGGAAWGRQRLQPGLRDARLQLHTLRQVAGQWVWQTDAQHRLLHLQPPPGAPAADWARAAAGRVCLWQLLDDDDRSLQRRLQAMAPLLDLPVRWQAGAGPGGVAAGVQRPAEACGASGTPETHATPGAADAADQPGGLSADRSSPNSLTWQVSGLPWHDETGQFAGYHGVARALPTTGSAAMPLLAPSAASAAAASVATEPAPSTADDAAQRALAEEHASFSYTVSHDLRAPIRVVEGFARILKEDYGPQLDRVGNDHLDRVMSAAARMNHMIDALLSLSRLSTEPLSRRPVDLSQLAHWVIDDLKRAQPERQVAVSIAPGLVANGDPTLLRMLMDNLLGNAWKYSAKVAQAEIRFERVQQGGRAVLVVQDNGAGFDMRFAERLFGVFQRLHSSSDFAGHGVGLASVKRIVRRHGGEIWADSEVGRGARFYFTLPG